MTKKYLIALSLALSLLLPSVHAHAQATRVAVVNLDRLLNDSNAAKASQAKLENEFSARQNAIIEQEKKMQDLIEAYRKDEPTLSESSKKQRVDAIRATEDKLTMTATEFQRDLSKRRADEMQMLLDKVNEAVKKIAASGKYDLVLTEAAFVKPELDITQKVLDQVNK